MVNNLRLAQFTLVAIVAVTMVGSSPAAAAAQTGSGNPAPAGQICPNGTFVIGFDPEGNILCSEACGEGVLKTAEDHNDDNTEIGDGSTMASQSEDMDPNGHDTELAVETTPTDPNSLRDDTVPVISDVEPSSVVWGTADVAITISGEGFHSESIILFEGKKYVPSVNQAGTRLEATIATRNLSLGSYAITVSNGYGIENTLKKALVVF